ncbi:MAG: DUF805 domain-containing protein [Alphaproteobacteria bacterium]|nr:DUF805 domain-containing protein [Alphaproteobacteria bacterium]
MPVKALFFSFTGRINRATYWTRAMPVLLAYGLLVNLVVLVEVDAIGSQGPVSTLLSLAGLWPNLAVAVKRLHDRDRSGWFVLIILIPFIGAIWLIIEVWLLKGTEGPNRFDEAPTATAARPVTAAASCVVLAALIFAVGFATWFEQRGPVPERAALPPPMSTDPSMPLPLEESPAAVEPPASAAAPVDQTGPVEITPDMVGPVESDETLPAKVVEDPSSTGN